MIIIQMKESNIVRLVVNKLNKKMIGGPTMSRPCGNAKQPRKITKANNYWGFCKFPGPTCQPFSPLDIVPLAPFFSVLFPFFYLISFSFLIHLEQHHCPSPASLIFPCATSAGAAPPHPSRCSLLVGAATCSLAYWQSSGDGMDGRDGRRNRGTSSCGVERRDTLPPHRGVWRTAVVPSSSTRWLLRRRQEYLLHFEVPSAAETGLSPIRRLRLRVTQLLLR
jgi:hypothetical protein